MATATQNISIRIAVVDGDKARRELTLTGEAGQRALAKIKEATAPAGKSLAALNVAGEQLRYGMEAVAASGGELAASLSRLGPAGLAAAAAIGALSFGLSAGLKEIANVEQANLRLAAVLRATGAVAGLTKQEIDDLADSMESSTLRTAEEVKDAASILLTFRSVTGDVFKDALKYAADAQTVFGGELSSSVTRLGKALEDPVEGLGALTKVGITFTPVQKEMIRNFVETGRTVEAQRVVLQAFEQQVGGTATAERQGLTGAAKGLDDAWGDLMETIGNTVNQSGIAQSSIAALTGAVRNLRDTIDPSQQQRKTQLEQDIASMENSFSTRLNLAVRGRAPGLEAKKRELQELNDALLAEQKKANDDKRKALKAADDADAANRNEALLKIEKDFQQKFKETTQTERDKILEEAATAKKRIELLFKDSRNSQSAQGAITAIDVATRAKISKLDAEAVKPTLQLAAANDNLVQSLQKRLTLERTVDPRRKFIQAELDKLNAQASQRYRDRVVELSGALYDLQQAEKQTQKAEENHAAAIDQINQALVQTKPSFDLAKQALDEWKAKLIESLGGATEANQQYVDKVEQIYSVKLKQIYDKSILDSDNWADGASRGLKRYADEATNAAKNAETLFSSAAGKVEDTLVDMVSTGEFSFKKLGDLVQSIEQDVLRMFIRQQITGPIAGALGDFFKGGSGGGGSAGGDMFSSFFSSIFHDGGVVGSSLVSRRAVPANAFIGAPRFHNGLMPDEFPAILQKGETVIPRNQKVGGNNITFNITTPNAQSFMDSQGQIMSKLATQMGRHKARNG